MATPESIAIRRANALGRVATATRAIAEQTGADIPDFPDAHKQSEMRPLIEAEWLAGALEAIAAATVPQAPEAPPDDEDDVQAVQGVDIDKLNRDDLNAYATGLGVADADTLPNKAALIAAIHARIAVLNADDGV